MIPIYFYFLTSALKKDDNAGNKINANKNYSLTGFDSDYLVSFEKLKKLKEENLISNEEYENSKKELLSKLTGK